VYVSWQSLFTRWGACSRSGSAKTKRTSSRPSATSGRPSFYQQIYISLTPIAVLTMSGPSTASIRRIVLTGSIAAITATGTWYGAGLKTQQERNQVKHDFFLHCTNLELIPHRTNKQPWNQPLQISLHRWRPCAVSSLTGGTSCRRRLIR
jgi:hypothetical protein